LGGTLSGTASININGTVGATTPTTGAFTTVTASGNISGDNATLGGNLTLPLTGKLNFNGATATDYMVGPSNGLIDSYIASSLKLRLSSTGLGLFGQFTVGTSAAGFAAILTNTNGASDSNGLYIQSGTTSTEYNLRLSNTSGSTDFMVVKGNGRVGIGTTSPTNMLDVRGTQPIIFVKDDAGTGAASFQAVNDSKISYFGRENSVGNYFFSTNVTPYSTVLNAYGSTAPIIFGHSGPEVWIANGGAIGVGSSPSYGTAGQVLTSSGSGSSPTWAAAGGGGAGAFVAFSTTGESVFAGQGF
jgi:hypothetical protein